jgi:mgtE-like transporter
MRYRGVQIIRQSLLAITIATLISSGGGLLLRSVEQRLLEVSALLILLPALMDMAGDFGCIIASRLSTAIYLGEIEVNTSYIRTIKSIRRNDRMRDFVSVVLVVAFLSSLYLGLATVTLSWLTRGPPQPLGKIVGVAVLGGGCLIGVVLVTSLAVGILARHKNLDLDNITIPIVTAVGDVGGIASLLFISKLVGLI